MTDGPGGCSRARQEKAPMSPREQGPGAQDGAPAPSRGEDKERGSAAIAPVLRRDEKQDHGHIFQRGRCLRA